MVKRKDVGSRRRYSEELKAEAVQMLLDGRFERFGRRCRVIQPIKREDPPPFLGNPLGGSKAGTRLASRLADDQ